MSQGKLAQYGISIFVTLILNGCSGGGGETSTAIVGSWSNLMQNGNSPEFGGGTNAAITFFANGDYMMAQSTTPPLATSVSKPGLEHGTYTWNPSTGAFATGGCPPIDTNGEAGFSHATPSVCGASTGTLTVNGDTLTFNNFENGVTQITTFTRVTDSTNPIVGSWSNLMQNGNSPEFGGGTNVAITFFANGDYMMAQSTTPPLAASGSKPGLEHGTYTWNPSTGAFATGGCPPIDTNGEAGFSHDTPGVCGASTGTMTVNGNTLTFNNGVTFTRVIP